MSDVCAVVARLLRALDTLKTMSRTMRWMSSIGEGPPDRIYDVLKSWKGFEEQWIASATVLELLKT